MLINNVMKIIKRYFYNDLLLYLDKDVVTALVGPRQTGKTTALNYIEDYLKKKRVNPAKNILMLNFDDFGIREKAADSNYLKQEISSTAGKNIDEIKDKFYLIIDEVQKEPRVFEQLKILYDRHKNIKIIISGSSTLDILDKSAESLAGRINFIRVNPFTMMEALILMEDYDVEYEDYDFVSLLLKGKLTEDKITEADKKYMFFKNSFEKYLNDFIVTGLLPRVIQEKKKEDRFQFLKNYKSTYIDRDIRLLKGVGDLRDFSRLLSIVSARLASTYEINSLSKKTGLDYRTVKKYISVLENTFIINQLEPYFANIEKRVVKTPKIYFFDNGLISLLMGIYNCEILEKMEKKGTFFENLIIGNIKKYADNEKIPVNCYYYRTYQGAEVDLVVESQAGILLFEVKYSETMRKKMLTGLKSIKEELGDKIHSSYIIYNGPFRKYDEDVFCIPSYLVM